MVPNSNNEGASYRIIIQAFDKQKIRGFRTVLSPILYGLCPIFIPMYQGLGYGTLKMGKVHERNCIQPSVIDNLA